jgi:imidazole glycerol-phosphate synthase subunit HisH
MTVIIDYGVGNLSSIKNMLKRCGADAMISAEPSAIKKAERLILPGVGSFDYGISRLRELESFEIIEDRVVNEKLAILGICLGAQLMTESSEEGSLPGLGWLQGKVVKFEENKLRPNNLKVPHMGWTDVVLRKTSRLFADMFPDPRFYFVHSFHFICNNSTDELLKAHYGYDFIAAFEVGNILGVQFHPEKSHKFGMKLCENFIKYY